MGRVGIAHRAARRGPRKVQEEALEESAPESPEEGREAAALMSGGIGLNRLGSVLRERRAAKQGVAEAAA